MPSMKKDLTEKQQAVLDYVKSRIESGVPPTYQEIADELGVLRNAAYCHMLAIERKGWIVITANMSRAIRLVE